MSDELIDPALPPRYDPPRSGAATARPRPTAPPHDHAELPAPPTDLIEALEQAEALFALTRRRGLAYADPVYRHLHPQLMRLKGELFRLCEACEDTVDYEPAVALLHRLVAVLRWRDL
jgi:hypothetical protein